MNDIEMFNFFVFVAIATATAVAVYALFHFVMFVAEYFGMSGWSAFGGFVAINMILSGPVLAYRL